MRQKGAVYKPGNGVGMGHDYTLFALKPGLVKFGKRFGKTLVKVVPTA
ncbi:MAG TPA: 50S ribosomal protein L27 [Candidatus Woesebacteria bacterium]|nr:50S ribosomal protein L27 [Candidatus Woesebacteria bacterium]